MKASLGQLVVLTPCGGVQAPGWRFARSVVGPLTRSSPGKLSYPSQGPFSGLRLSPARSLAMFLLATPCHMRSGGRKSTDVTDVISS